MRVKMLMEVCGKPTYHTGQIIDLEPRIAKAWIADGIAAPVRPDEPNESDGRAAGAR